MRHKMFNFFQPGPHTHACRHTPRTHRLIHMPLQKNDCVRRAGDEEGSVCPIGFVRKVDEK